MLCGPIMSYLPELSMFTGQESLHEVMACLSEVVGNLYDSLSKLLGSSGSTGSTEHMHSDHSELLKPFL